MENFTLSDVTQAERSEAEQFLIDQIRTAYPNLDLRPGTALRDLLVGPDALIHALFSKTAEELRNSSSLQVLLERSSAGEGIDSDDLSRLLSNFNMSGVFGTTAKGLILIRVSEPRTYIVNAGDVFETLDGLQFVADSTTYHSSSASDGSMYMANGSYYFTVPVTCSVVGGQGNIQKNTVFYYRNAFANFMSAVAYSDFSGGSDIEDISSLKTRIISSLSARGLFTKTTVEAVLRDRFDSEMINPILDVSVVGYGNPAQLRDKHNPFGVGVGGRADVYVRNFTSAPVVAITKECKLDSATGDYICTISPEDAPGMWCVDSVSDVGAKALSSYSFSASYAMSDAADTWHDIDFTGNDGVELAGTVWRGCTIKIHDTGRDDATSMFNIDVIAVPRAQDMQSLMDSDNVRNVAADYVVRCPAICKLAVSARCYYKSGLSFDVESARSAVIDYINTSGFVGKITRSEIACVLKECGATRVDLSDMGMLTGTVIDANGNSHSISGDSIDIDSLGLPNVLLTGKTTVFTTKQNSVDIVAVPE